MLTALLGLEPDGFSGRLRVIRPVLPAASAGSTSRACGSVGARSICTSSAAPTGASASPPGGSSELTVVPE
jgi:hypothetical protein